MRIEQLVVLVERLEMLKIVSGAKLVEALTAWLVFEEIGCQDVAQSSSACSS